MRSARQRVERETSDFYPRVRAPFAVRVTAAAENQYWFVVRARQRDRERN